MTTNGLFQIALFLALLAALARPLGSGSSGAIAHS